MSFPRDPAKVMVFAAVTFNTEEADNIIPALGEIYSSSDEYRLDKHTNYYKDEMGENLRKKIYLFKGTITPDSIVAVKIKSHELEKQFSINNKRRLNIDPGYIGLPKVVLASFKDFSHRIYLGSRVYAEVTLVYSRESHSFKGLSWTYPDYKCNPALNFLNNGRKIVADQQDGNW